MDDNLETSHLESKIDNKQMDSTEGVRNGPSLSVVAMPVLSYALAYNQVQVVSKITISGGERMVRGARLTISLSDVHGPVGAPDERIVDIEANLDTVLTQVDFELDPSAMYRIEERRPGTLTFDLYEGEALLASTTVDVQLLAANQWLARPVSLGLELLAAFVLPHDPAVHALTADAAHRLGASTGSDAMQGYQAGPERVDEIVRAIVEEMHARDIRYVLPPASWSDLHGQKVRTPEEVLVGGAGTCLDTVVVLAAALEHTGIRPLLWVVDGHAFLGYWRVERSLESAARIDVGDLINWIDLGAIGLIETTLVTNDSPLDFDRMQRDLVHEWLSGSQLRVLGVTDVYRARRDRIWPLPSRRKDDTGSSTTIVYAPPTSATLPAAPTVAPARAPDDAIEPDRPQAPARVAHWKNALLDLSLRNRLINFTDHARLPLALPPERLARFEDEISNSQSYTLVPSDRIGAVNVARELQRADDLPPELLLEQFDTRRTIFTGMASGTYLTRMRRLAYDAKTLVEETGANNLYLAFGSLIWSLDGRQLRSPLILVPVLIAPVARQSVYRVTLDESGASTPNYCLLEKLRQTHGLEIPELELPVADGSGIDLASTLLATRTALAAKGLGFRVEDTVDLAILQFAKYRLWKDLDEHWESFEENALVRHLIRTPFEPFVDPIERDDSVDLDELAAKSPMPADSSQLAAVSEAVSGKTFVLEGPPGTGKSQTITNLLTRSIAGGKKVLFVAEKRAALDVVQRRLEEVGLGVFSLDLHDRHSKPNEVRRQIRAALEAVFDVDDQGYVDTLNRLESARRRLDAYPKRLHETNAAGHSYYSARTQELTIDASVPRLPIPDRWPGEVTSESIASIRSLLNTLADVSDAARPANPHPWGIVDAPGAARLDAQAIRSAAASFEAAVSQLPVDGPFADILGSIRQVEAFIALVAILEAPEFEQLAVLDAVRSSDWQLGSQRVQRELSDFAAKWSPLLSDVTPDALSLDLGDIDREAREAETSGFFGRKKRLKAAASRLDGVLQPGSSLDPKQLTGLTGRLATLEIEARDLRQGLNALAGVHPPDGWNPLRPEDRTWIEQRIAWLRWNATLVDAAGDERRSAFVSALRSLYQARPTVEEQFAARVRAASDALQSLVAEGRVQSDDLFIWSGDDGLLSRWRETAIARRVEDDRAATIRAWCDLLEWVEPLRDNGLLAARRALLDGEVPADDAVRAFEAGIAVASRRERSAATGIESFDDRAHERRINRFTEASAAIREHLTVTIPREVVRSRGFDPRSDAGRVGRLTRELNRQRGGMGVRTLLDNFGDLITAIMPCVLVSPDSVVRFFPARSGLFDIVVFDEASQIRVADSIGAMGRGRSVVVVGDSKQMPPTSFAEPISAIDEALADEGVAEDEESILTECVNAQVPRRWLSWHYRSQDEALIAFSNQQYYDQKLSSFPAPVHGDSDPGPDGHGVSLVKVDGVFHRNGRHVVDHVLERVPVERVVPHLDDVVEAVELLAVERREVPVAEGDGEPEEKRKDDHRNDEERGRQHEERALALLTPLDDLHRAQDDGPQDVGVKERPPGGKAELDDEIVDDERRCHDGDERRRTPEERAAEPLAAIGNVVRLDGVQEIAFEVHRPSG